MKNVSQPLITVDNGRFSVNEETAAIISAIKEPVAIAAIAGSYRTGKSFLLNQLLGRQNGYVILSVY
jgi:tRNA U34 5-carboxymethylaminomethyl modifying GTPase MnmE/TrmE